jgi:hypothetical protein
MKLRKPLIITAIAFTGLVAGGATPAAANDTATTFALTAGPLSLTVQPTATLTDEATGVPANVITGTLGLVSVDDTRGGVLTWEVSVISTAFVGALGAPSSSTSVSYTAGVVTETGTITVADGALTVVDTEQAVVSPTSLSGNNTASWTPTLDVSMPAGSLADTYTGTVSTSIL